MVEPSNGPAAGYCLIWLLLLLGSTGFLDCTGLVGREEGGRERREGERGGRKGEREEGGRERDEAARQNFAINTSRKRRTLWVNTDPLVKLSDDGAIYSMLLPIRLFHCSHHNFD